MKAASAIITAVFLIVPVIAHAATVRRVPASALARLADEISIGRIAALQAEIHQFRGMEVVYRRATVKVERVLKGQPVTRLDVFLIGGTKGGMTTHAGAELHAQGGDRVLLVLRRGPFGFEPLGQWQGLFVEQRAGGFARHRGQTRTLNAQMGRLGAR